jgi:hypothetical protein
VLGVSSTTTDGVGAAYRRALDRYRIMIGAKRKCRSFMAASILFHTFIIDRQGHAAQHVSWSIRRLPEWDSQTPEDQRGCRDSVQRGLALCFAQTNIIISRPLRR